MKDRYLFGQIDTEKNRQGETEPHPIEAKLPITCTSYVLLKYRFVHYMNEKVFFFTSCLSYCSSNVHNRMVILVQCLYCMRMPNDDLQQEIRLNKQKNSGKLILK